MSNMVVKNELASSSNLNLDLPPTGLAILALAGVVKKICDAKGNLLKVSTKAFAIILTTDFSDFAELFFTF